MFDGRNFRAKKQHKELQSGFNGHILGLWGGRYRSLFIGIFLCYDKIRHLRWYSFRDVERCSLRGQLFRKLPSRPPPPKKRTGHGNTMRGDCIRCHFPCGRDFYEGFAFHGHLPQSCNAPCLRCNRWDNRGKFQGENVKKISFSRSFYIS